MDSAGKTFQKNINLWVLSQKVFDLLHFKWFFRPQKAVSAKSGLSEGVKNELFWENAETARDNFFLISSKHSKECN